MTLHTKKSIHLTDGISKLWTNESLHVGKKPINTPLKFSVLLMESIVLHSNFEILRWDDLLINFFPYAKFLVHVFGWNHLSS